MRGWVRNRRDGSVEALLQGDAATVAQLIAWTRHGPPAARVESLHESDAESACAEPYHSFEERPTA